MWLKSCCRSINSYLYPSLFISLSDPPQGTRLDASRAPGTPSQTRNTHKIPLPSCISHSLAINGYVHIKAALIHNCTHLSSQIYLNHLIRPWPKVWNHLPRLISQPKFNRFPKNMSGLESSWNLLSDATFPKLLSLFTKKLQGKTWIIHFLKMIKNCHQFSYAYESLLISQPKFSWFSKNMGGLESSWNLL